MHNQTCESRCPNKGRQVSLMSCHAATSTAGELIVIALADSLRALSSSTSNDVVVGGNFTTDGFTRRLTTLENLCLFVVCKDDFESRSPGQSRMRAQRGRGPQL